MGVPGVGPVRRQPEQRRRRLHRLAQDRQPPYRVFLKVRGIDGGRPRGHHETHRPGQQPALHGIGEIAGMKTPPRLLDHRDERPWVIGMGLEGGVGPQQLEEVIDGRVGLPIRPVKTAPVGEQGGAAIAINPVAIGKALPGEPRHDGRVGGFLHPVARAAQGPMPVKGQMHQLYSPSGSPPIFVVPAKPDAVAGLLPAARAGSAKLSTVARRAHGAVRRKAAQAAQPAAASMKRASTMSRPVTPPASSVVSTTSTRL